MSSAPPSRQYYTSNGIEAGKKAKAEVIGLAKLEAVYNRIASTLHSDDTARHVQVKRLLQLVAESKTNIWETFHGDRAVDSLAVAKRDLSCELYKLYPGEPVEDDGGPLSENMKVLSERHVGADELRMQHVRTLNRLRAELKTNWDEINKGSERLVAGIETDKRYEAGTWTWLRNGDKTADDKTAGDKTADDETAGNKTAGDSIERTLAMR